MRFHKDPLVRRFVSGSLFAGLFVWVAVRYFDVDTEVVYVLFIMSFVFVGGLMLVGVAGALLVRLFRGEQVGMLGNLDAAEEPPDEDRAPSVPGRDGG